MPIFNYNAKLGWVVAACVFWGLLVNVAARQQFRLGWGERVIAIEGRLVEVRESADRLELTVEAPRSRRLVVGNDGQMLKQLPADLAISFVEMSDSRRPPRISLVSGRNEPRRLPNNRFEIATRRYLLKVSRGQIRVIPTPQPPAEGGPGQPLHEPGRFRDNDLPPGPGAGDRPGPGQPPAGDREQRFPRNPDQRPPQGR